MQVTIALFDHFTASTLIMRVTAWAAVRVRLGSAMKSRIHVNDICHNVPADSSAPTSSYQDRKSRDRSVSLVAAIPVAITSG